jgi:hypothetical protein
MLPDLVILRLQMSEQKTLLRRYFAATSRECPSSPRMRSLINSTQWPLEVLSLRISALKLG